MKIQKLVDIAIRHLTSYYRIINDAIASRRICIKEGEKFFFPTIALFTVTPQHYILELIGYASSFENLKTCMRKINSTASYFDQFGSEDADPALNIENRYISFENITLCRKQDIEILEQRFPIISRQKQFFDLYRPEGTGSLIRFGKNIGVITLDKFLFLNAQEQITRMKFVNRLHLIEKNIHSSEFKAFLDKSYNLEQVEFRTHTVGHNDEAFLEVGGLQSLFLSRSTHETTIGAYLSSHEEILLKAFSAKSVIYEPTLPWIEKPDSCEDKEINPDFLLQRAHGNFDILDLKTALLEKRKLTTGGFKRRRFISCVYEGIAQLANYLSYFEHERNREEAFKRLGVRVANPRGILVIGSYENYSTQLIEQALRSHPKIEVVDYDTIGQLYIASNS